MHLSYTKSIYVFCLYSEYTSTNSVELECRMCNNKGSETVQSVI